MPDHGDDIHFLQELRERIDSYLFLGYAPSRGSAWGRGEGAAEMDEAERGSPELRSLRKEINQMVTRGQRLLAKVGVPDTITEYPAAMVGGPVQNFQLFSLVTDNRSSFNHDRQDFLDKIDQAIGGLGDMTQGAVTGVVGVKHPQAGLEHGLVFIIMPMDEEADPGLADVHDAIKQTATELGLTARRVDDVQTTDRITPTVIEQLGRAEYVVADLTHNRPNVYYEAGYADALGKTPVFVAKEGTQLEFDTKDFPVLFFKTMKQLRERLRSKLAGLMKASENV